MVKGCPLPTHNKYTAFIFARGGSKGIPNKNVKLFAGKPLLAWSIDAALSTGKIKNVIVSTDSEDIAAVALKWGATVPYLRPQELSSDYASEIGAWKHAIVEYLKATGEMPQPFISVPTTSPLRDPSDILSCIAKFENTQSDIVVTVSEARRNPWFNMLKLEDDGLMEIVNSKRDRFSRRQDAPNVYDLATVAYVADPNYILKTDHILSGKVRAVTVPSLRCIDIDTPDDFILAELIKINKLY